MADLKIERQASSGSVIVTVAGEIDLTNTERFSHGLREAASERSGMLVVDLANVDYLDSAGIRVLFEIAETLEASRQSMALVVPEGSSLTRLFVITDMEQVARIVPTVQDALGAGEPSA
jgi:anti-anti-sigma factor